MNSCVLLLKNETTPKLNRSQIDRVFSSEKQELWPAISQLHRPIGIIMSFILFSACWQFWGVKGCLTYGHNVFFHWSDLNSFSGRDKENADIISVQDVAEGWTVWGRWGDCIGTCGYGTHSRERFCLSAGPEASRAGCHGSYVESKACRHRYACPKYGLH